MPQIGIYSYEEHNLQDLPTEDSTKQSILNTDNELISSEETDNQQQQNLKDDYHFQNLQLVLKDTNNRSSVTEQTNELKVSSNDNKLNTPDNKQSDESTETSSKKKTNKKTHNQQPSTCKTNLSEPKYNMQYNYPTHSPGKAIFEGIFGCIRPILNFWSTTKSNLNQNLKDGEDFDVPFEALTDLQWLGSGAQGCVFKGFLNNEEVAIKKVKSKEEANISKLRKLNHPNLVKFKGVSLNGDKFFCIIMEFCPYGQLFTYLNNTKQNKILRPAKMMDWSKQIAKGMYYLHNNKIIHRDLKSPKYNTIKIYLSKLSSNLIYFI